MTITLTFGKFEYRPGSRQLLLDGQPIALGARAFDVLHALIERRERLVTKEELLELAWPGLIVEENNLQVQISSLRKVLGPAAIVTVPGRGYHFTLAPTSQHVEPIELKSEPKHNLPEQLTSFIGRENDLTDVRDLLIGHRLVTLVGAGGIGKTRASLQVAAKLVSAFVDGVWFVDLAPITDPTQVPATVASVLGIDLGDGEAQAAPLARRLRSFDCLLLIDNSEHLLSAVADIVESLLRTALKVRVLATSREPLGIGGEQVFRLSPLTIPKEKPLNSGELLEFDAVRLFIERAKAAGARLVLNDSDAATIAAVCRRLDGLPLAIEMAAARTPALTLEELHQKLDDRFRLLTSLRRGALPRHETLHATLDWSYALLTEVERVLLRRVAIFGGGFTREAACFIAPDLGDEPEVFNLLSRLVGRSLIVADTTGSHARYRLLETTRAYALEKLVDPREKTAIARRHAEHFANLFKRASNEWPYSPDADWNGRYLQERDNVRTALAWSFAPDGEQASGITLAGASARLWYELSLNAEGRRWLEGALAVVRPETPEVDQARLWVGLGLLWHVAAPAKAVAALVRGTDLYRRLGLAAELGYSLTRLATNLALMGRYEQAASTLAEAFPVLTQAGIPKALASYYSSLGFLESITSKLDLARMHYQQALTFARQTGHEAHALDVLGSLADVNWALGELESALEGFRETVALVRKLPGIKRSLLGTQLLNLAGVLIGRGQLVDALVPAREGLPLCKEQGSVWMNMDHLALRAALAGNLVRAAHLAGFVDSALAIREISRGPNEERAHDQLRRLLRERFSPEELSGLLTDGANLTEDEACRLALED